MHASANIHTTTATTKYAILDLLLLNADTDVSTKRKLRS